MKPEKEVALVSKLVKKLFSKGDEEYKQLAADRWEKESYELKKYCEDVTSDLGEFVQDDAIEEYVKDFMDDIVNEYYEDGTMGKAIVEFQKFLEDTIEKFANENKVALDIASLVEGILNGVTVEGTIYNDSYTKIKL